MLTSTALVLMMTIPGLALFYGGMVRKKNVLATLMQSFAITCLVTVLWVIVGYSLAFMPGELVHRQPRPAVPQRHAVPEGGRQDDRVAPRATTIPESVYMTFQMTFAIITPALICGAFADRMKFSAMLWFMGLWSLLIYSPIAHMMWEPSGLSGQRRACSTSPAARSCTSTPVSRAWCARSCSASGSATARKRWRRTT